MMAKQNKIKICYIAGREESYSRTRTMIYGLHNAGFEVVTCLPPDKSFKNYPRLIWQFLQKKKGCDLIVVGFYGQILMPFVWMLTLKPILYDVYISTFDTMIHDRSQGGAGSIMAKIYWLSDKISMILADRIILETKDHIRDYARKFGVPEKKFYHIFLATDERLICPRESASENGKFLVHFHGEYAPFHGVQYILKAAALLKDEGVEFQIIGRGITYEKDRKLADELDLQNCTFIDWVPYEQLADYMSRANCCLGFFGDNPRTLRVFTNKVVEALAVARPLISTKNAPVQELLTDGESALLVERANPEAIADAICKLKEDRELRKRVADRGHELFLQNCTLEVFSQKIKTIVEEMLNS